jgi:hypothetical protein
VVASHAQVIVSQPFIEASTQALDTKVRAARDEKICESRLRFVQLPMMASEEVDSTLALISHDPITSFDTKSTFALLSFELPDPDQELFIQLGNGLSVFTLFQKLPLEVRLKVWRSAFPRSRKRFLDYIPDGSEYDGDYSPETEKAFLQHKFDPLPSTLLINRESRAETLRFYCLASYVCGGNGFSPRFTNKPLCFAPTRDVARIIFPSFWSKDFSTWLNHLDRQMPRGLTSIRYLEICETTYMDENSQVWPMPGVGSDAFYLFLNRIFEFEGLEKASFIFKTHYTINGFVRKYKQKRLERFKTLMREVFENCIATGVCKVEKLPEIEVRPWEKLGRWP